MLILLLLLMSHIFRIQDRLMFTLSLGNSYEYIAEVFQMARDYEKEKTQEIKLIYNDSDNHYADGLSSGISRSIVSMLIEKDLIDYVGIQAHIGEWREGAFDELMVPQMPAEIEFYKKLGVPVLITELTYQPDSNSYRSDSTLAMPPAEFEKRLSHVLEKYSELPLSLAMSKEYILGCDR